MVWRALGYNTKGPLIWVDLEPSRGNGKTRTKAEGLNRLKYTEQILRGPLLEFYTQVKNTTGKDTLVMEDGAPAHHAKYTKTAQDELCMPSHQHPPSSPDLNPIEPLWLILKTQVSRVPRAYNSLDRMWEVTQKVWDEISVKDILKHTGNMDDRVADVLSNHGKHTRF